MRKESKHNTKENHQTTRKEKKKQRETIKIAKKQVTECQ